MKALPVQPSLRDSNLVRPSHPSDESLGYSHLPLRGIHGDATNTPGRLRPRLKAAIIGVVSPDVVEVIAR